MKGRVGHVEELGGTGKEVSPRLATVLVGEVLEQVRRVSGGGGGGQFWCKLTTPRKSKDRESTLPLTALLSGMLGGESPGAKINGKSHQERNGS